MANSFKKMTTSGVIKRLHSGMFIRLEDIHIKDGFNKRENDDRTQQADDELFEFLAVAVVTSAAVTRVNRLSSSASYRSRGTTLTA